MTRHPAPSGRDLAAEVAAGDLAGIAAAASATLTQGDQPMTPTLTPTTDEFGPQGEHVIALIGRLRNLTPEEVSSFRAAAWDAARDAAWAAAWDATTAAARDAARDAAWAAAGLVVRDLISTEHYDELTRVVRTTLGPIHPDDPAMTL